MGLSQMWRKGRHRRYQLPGEACRGIARERFVGTNVALEAPLIGFLAERIAFCSPRAASSDSVIRIRRDRAAWPGGSSEVGRDARRLGFVRQARLRSQTAHATKQMTAA